MAGAVSTLDRRVTTVDGVAVRVQATRQRVIIQHQRFLYDRAVVTADHLGCGDMEAEVRPGSYFLALGRQDVEVGHAGFDDRYIVKSNAPAAAAFWMSERSCDAMLTTYDPTAMFPFVLELTPQTVVLTARAEPEIETPWSLRGPASLPWPDLPAQVTRVDAAIAAAATIAGRGADLAGTWRRRLTPLGLIEAGPVWTTDDRYSAVVISGRTRIVVDFPWRTHQLAGRGLRTRLSIAWSKAAPNRAQELARDVAAADWLFVGSGQLSLGWETVVDDTGRLEAAFRLLTGWAEHERTTDGPYR